jgi:hypothetical protein
VHAFNGLNLGLDDTHSTFTIPLWLSSLFRA